MGIATRVSTSLTNGSGHHEDTAASQLGPLVHLFAGEPLAVRVRFWDGSELGPERSRGLLRVNSPDAVRQILWAPGELGLARAYVLGEIDVDGDIVEIAQLLSRCSVRDVPLVRNAPDLMSMALRAGVLGRPFPPPQIEHQPNGLRRHTLRRDADAIAHHYDVSSGFYEMVLGESMTYSCARFATPQMSLAQAQASKHEHVCRKLGLDRRRGMRLLDVGCGWGSMAIHAAAHHGAEVVGITISAAQADAARRRVAHAGLEDQIEIRLQDYRDVNGETFDAISSIGMSEHVGSEMLTTYFEVLRRALRPHGRLLNHAISSVGGSKLPRRSFIARYVFPDGELIDLAETVSAMQHAGFEVRDVESLREQYATTLRHWLSNLDAHWQTAVDEAGLQRARVWRLYMAASAVGFTDGGLNLHQVLGVVTDHGGGSGMPDTRPV